MFGFVNKIKSKLPSVPMLGVKNMSIVLPHQLPLEKVDDMNQNCGLIFLGEPLFKEIF